MSSAQPSDAALKRAQNLAMQVTSDTGKHYDGIVAAIAAAIDEAKREEREECAKIADASEEDAEKDYRRWYNSCDQGRSDASAEIASAIRNR